MSRTHARPPPCLPPPSPARRRSKWVEVYAKDDARFRADFASAFGRLLELGVPFPAGAKPIAFKPVA